MLFVGVFRRMVMWVRDYVKLKNPKEGLDVLDKRMTKIKEIGWVELRLPTIKFLWQSPTSLQANEYRSLMQVVMVKFKVYGSLSHLH